MGRIETETQLVISSRETQAVADLITGWPECAGPISGSQIEAASHSEPHHVRSRTVIVDPDIPGTKKVHLYTPGCYSIETDAEGIDCRLVDEVGTAESKGLREV